MWVVDEDVTLEGLGTGAAPAAATVAVPPAHAMVPQDDQPKEKSPVNTMSMPPAALPKEMSPVNILPIPPAATRRNSLNRTLVRGQRNRPSMTR